jgi:hypothetical protein
MAADSGTTFPFTAVTVVLLFLSTSFLGQRAFDLWRQADPDAGKQVQLSEPPVEARLWEDPLAAFSRYREKLKETCPTGANAAPAGSSSESRCRAAQPANSETFKAAFGGSGDRLTLIAAMLPGAALVGAEELRRRTRYALLAGLNAEGYVPDDSEHLGLLRARYCESFSGCDDERPAMARIAKWIAILRGLPASMDIVYETLRTKQSDPAQQRRVAVLWIDDTKTSQRWLSALTILLKDLSPDAGVRLRILGPSGSDALVRALGDDVAKLQQEADDVESKGDATTFRKNWETLLKLQLISSQSTAPAKQLLTAAHRSGACPDNKDCVDDVFRSLFEKIHHTIHYKLPVRLSPFFIRTVGTDDRLIKGLVNELSGRGLDLCGTGRVILIAEWDSIYARTFGESLGGELRCNGKASSLELKTYSYLRGLDGVTLDDSATRARRNTDSARSNERKAPPIEWPEGRGQEDYIRRLVQDILKDNERKPVQVVGMIGGDVHDKLVLVQALRDAFPDRTLFTTDMDARLLHPSMTRYTRNVIVASSLDLTWDEETRDCPKRADVLPNGVGPFRDAYQTSTFLAARRAAATDENAQALACHIDKAVAHPVLFEIGRDGMVRLPDKGVPGPEKHKRLIFALLTIAVFVSIGGLMLVGRPAPGMLAAWSWWSGDEDNALRTFDGSKAFVAGLEMAALGYAAGVAAELAAPGSAGDLGPVLLAAAAATLFWAFIYPGTRWAQALRPGPSKTGANPAPIWLWGRVGLQLLLLVAVVSAVWWFVIAQPADSEMREPSAVLSGTSAWPSQVLRTLAIVLFVWFLDNTWCRSAIAAGEIEDVYFPAGTRDAASKASKDKAESKLEGLRNTTVWFWQPDVVLRGGRVDGARLWHEYRLLMTNRRRFARLLFWLALSISLIVLVMVLVQTLTDGATPDIPARGLTDRALFRNTQAISGIAVIILLVLVGDVTILTWRFVDMLKRGRTVYPPETVARFAAELGPELREQATEPVAAYPEQRGQTWDGPKAPPCRNSLLDDWIDARLLAEHTAKVGPLIVFPFILVALVVMARSRIFDNWDIGGAVLAVLVGYVLWSIAMAALLNFGAERARQKALEGMQADLLWLKGAGAGFDKLADRFPTLIDRVTNLRKGAFAPFFQQPLVQAILVPLGGAGGIQLLDLLLYARTQ